MSGAGRSAAADVLEDLGWYVVDNLPTSLVEKIVELASRPAAAIDRLALVAGRNYGDRCSTRSPRCAPPGTASRVLFLDADDAELVRRYDAHAAQAPAGRRGRRAASSRSSSSGAAARHP